MKKITNPCDVKPNSILLLMNKNTGKVSGVDKIISLDKKTKKYKYICGVGDSKGNIFDHNLQNAFLTSHVYLLDDVSFAYKYDDVHLEKALVNFSQGHLFSEVIYQLSEESQVIKGFFYKTLYADVKNRIKFIDLYNKHIDIIHKLTFIDYRNDVPKEKRNAFVQEIRDLIKEFSL